MGKPLELVLLVRMVGKLRCHPQPLNNHMFSCSSIMLTLKQKVKECYNHKPQNFKNQTAATKSSKSISMIKVKYKR